MAGFSYGDRVKSSDIWEGLIIELLLLHIEGSHWRSFGHMFRIPRGWLPVELLKFCPIRRKPKDSEGGIIPLKIACGYHRVPPEVLVEVAEKRTDWESL